MNNKNHPLYNVLSNVSSTSCPLNINFHCHTTYSDGSLTPNELIIQACKIGLSHLSITDHHSVEAYVEIMESISSSENNKFLKPKLWTGIEVTGLLKGCLVHILGFGFDINNNHINKYMRGESLTGRSLSAEAIVDSIHNSFGLAVLAHPARYKIYYRELINEAKILGFDGIEVWYDYERKKNWSPSPYICVDMYNMCRELNLLSTCGTDTHGKNLLHR